MKRPLVLFRADSSESIGFGHVMRCLTIAQSLLEFGCKVRVVSKKNNQFLELLAASKGIEIETIPLDADEQAELRHLNLSDADFLVIDGYDFEASFFESLEIPYCLLDDNGQFCPENAALILNPNLHARRAMYSGIDIDRLLLGVEFAPIRQEIIDARRNRSDRARTGLLVAIGGTDLLNMTHSIAEQCVRAGIEPVFASLKGKPPPGVSKNPPDISVTFSTCAVSVIGAGSTCWEACYLGTPFLALIVAENQVLLGRSLQERNLGRVFDCRIRWSVKEILDSIRSLENSPSELRRMSERGRDLIDGGGSLRVAESIWRLLR